MWNFLAQMFMTHLVRNVVISLCTSTCELFYVKSNKMSFRVHSNVLFVCRLHNVSFWRSGLYLNFSYKICSAEAIRALKWAHKKTQKQKRRQWNRDDYQQLTDDIQKMSFCVFVESLHKWALINDSAKLFLANLHCSRNAESSLVKKMAA